MKLPNTERAVVEQGKITEYLLNPQHRFGGSKAWFFAQFGFRPEEWPVLADALREHGGQFEVSSERNGFWPAL